MIIVTGGVNRHSGIVEAHEFFDRLVDRGVPETVIRCEDHRRQHVAERRVVSITFCARRWPPGGESPRSAVDITAAL